MKHLTTMDSMTKQELLDIINLADQLKYEQKNGIAHKHLLGKTLGMIFQKASTRTRVSFEVGMYQLGGYPLFLSASDLQIGRGEPVKDTARVLSRYLDGIMIRTFAQQEVEDLAKYGSIPVINGLTDYEHPCQILADLMTIREVKGKLAGLKVAYVGDGNNMVNSWIKGALLLDMKISIATPKGFEPDAKIIKQAQQSPDFELTTNPITAVRGADVIITDVFASMGQEAEAVQRLAAFKGFKVDEALVSHANFDHIVLHCLPAHREEEISAVVLEKHADVIFTEAENRLHVQKAVLVKLMGNM
ncbi:MAG: ornithine carbamoyltransferase [Culicoidibacterales bacterium]